MGHINHSGFSKKIFCGGDNHMLETKCPLQMAVQIPLISRQIIQNAPNPLDFSREENFPTSREGTWVHFNHHKWKPPLIFIRYFMMAICIIYSYAPLKGQFPWKLAWLQASLCRKWPMSKRNLGRQMDDISYPLGMIDSIKPL